MSEILFDELNQMDDEAFVETLKDVFEHSSWVGDRVKGQRPFKSIRSLHGAMVDAVLNANKREQHDLICAHPDLAGKAALAGNLTQASTHEQAGAGLDSLTAEEYEQFHQLNTQYKAKFDFPFILAVKGHDKHSILAAFQCRLENSESAEKNEALKQIAEIARFRLEAMLTHA